MPLEQFRVFFAVKLHPLLTIVLLIVKTRSKASCSIIIWTFTRRELAFLFGVALFTTISSETWCLNSLASDFVSVSMCQHYPSEIHESTAAEECLNARSHQIDVVNFDQEDICTSLMKYDTTHYEIVGPPCYKMLNLCLQSSSLRNLGLWSQILTRN